MLSRSAVFFFPLLSILVGTLGAVAFLAGSLALLGGGRGGGERGVSVRVEWEGAPRTVRPVLLECRPDGVMMHEGGGRAPRFFSLERLAREAEVVRDLHERGTAQAGAELSRDQEWLFFKAVVERDPRLKDSLTLALHRVEIGNLKREARVREARYPILLVSADGLDSYELATRLAESTTRLPLAAEPVLAGWRVQEPDSPSAPGASAPATPSPTIPSPAGQGSRR
jgi:hypothetical protein